MQEFSLSLYYARGHPATFRGDFPAVSGSRAVISSREQSRRAECVSQVHGCNGPVLKTGPHFDFKLNINMFARLKQFSNLAEHKIPPSIQHKHKIEWKNPALSNGRAQGRNRAGLSVFGACASRMSRIWDKLQLRHFTAHSRIVPIVQCSSASLGH